MTVRRRDEVLVCHVSISERNDACYQKEDTHRVPSRMMQQAWRGATCLHPDEDTPPSTIPIRPTYFDPNRSATH